MISRKDIADGITMCTGFDPVHTPKASEAVMAAWQLHFDTYPSVTREQFLNAIAEYYKSPNRQFPQPADICALAYKQSPNADARYHEALSDALCAQDDSETDEEFADRVNAAYRVIAQYRAISIGEAKVWVLQKRETNAPPQRPALASRRPASDEPAYERPKHGLMVLTRDGLIPTKPLWQLGRHTGVTESERVDRVLREDAENKADPERMYEVYRRAYERAGLLPGTGI